MQRQVADIRTRFAVVGLDGVQAAFRATGAALANVTRASRQAGQQAAQAGAQATAAAQAAARQQTQAAAQAAAQQLRQAQEAARRQTELARQQAVERIRLAREAAQQAQRAAADAASRAAAQQGPTPGMTPAQAAAARAAQDAARQQARDAAAAARAQNQAYQEELRQARVRQAQADREARRQVQAAQAAARAAAAAAAAQARQDAADHAARLRQIREEAAQRQQQARADAAARAAQLRADAQASRDRIRQLRDLARQQAELDRQRLAALRAQEAADEAAARAALAAARAAQGAQRAAARQAARDALERLRQSRAAAQAAAAAAAAQQAELARQAQAEARIQAERQRRASEAARREMANIRAETAARLRAERDAERARREADRASRSSGQGARQAGDQRADAERRVRGEVEQTTQAVEKQEKEAGKLAAMFAKIGGAAGGLGKLGLGTLKLGVGAGVAGAVGGAGLAAGAFGLSKKVTSEASDYATSTYYASLSTGLDSQTFSQLADAAKKYGLELDDLRGSLIGFQGVIADSGTAGAGDPIFDQLKAAGVDISAVNGKLKTTDELLIPILTALRGMAQTEKIGLMGKLFGEDDAGKLMPLFNELLDNPDMMKKALERQKIFGNFINREDLKTAQQYKAAVQDMSDAYHGLSLEIAKVVGPDISRLMAGAAADIGRNRVAIAAVFGSAVQKIGSIVGDVFNLTLFGENYAPYVRNAWILPVRDAFAVIGQIARATFRLIGEGLQALAFNDAKVVEFPWLLTLRDGAIATFTFLKTFVTDAWNVILLRDYNVSGQFPWMQTMRDSVLAFVDDLKRIWADLSAVWGGAEQASTGPGTMLLGLVQGFRDARTYIEEWVTWFRALGADIAKVWDQIGRPEKDSAFNFAWMKPLADGFWFVADAAHEAYGWFKQVYKVIFDFVKEYIGLNFESMLFFVAFVKFTGTLAGLLIALNLVLAPFKLLVGLLGFVGGGAGAAAGAAGAAGAVTGLAAAFDKLKIALGAIAAFASNPLVMAILGGIGGGVALASALKGTVVDQAIGQFESWINDRENSPGAKALREANANLSPQQEFGIRVRQGQARPEDWPAWFAQQQALQAQQASWQAQLEAEFTRNRQAAAPTALDFRTGGQAGGGNSITLNFPDYGKIEATQTDDQYAQLLRDFRRRG